MSKGSKKKAPAWAKGLLPQNTSSSRSQSSAPSHAPLPITTSHSPRPSASGQGVLIQEGVSVPRSNVSSVREVFSVTFGSIDDVAAPLSSSPTATPVVNIKSVKSFGSIPATTSKLVNGKAFASGAGSSKLPARSVSPTTSTFSNVTSASTTSATIATTTAKSALGKADIVKLFQGSYPASSQLASDTPSPSTRPSNGTGAPPRPMRNPGGPGSLLIPASPRLALHHSHPHQPRAGVAPQQVPMQPKHWSPYYYPVDPYSGKPASPWFYPAHVMHQQPHTLHTPHPPSAGPQGPPHPGIAMSPRNPPPTVPRPPPTVQPPFPRTHQPSGSIGVSSLPPTPSTATGPRIRSLNTNATTFVPTTRTSKAIVIKKEDGTEVDLEPLKKLSQQRPTVPTPVRIESKAEKRKRKQEKKEAAERAKREKQERKQKEKEEVKRKEEEEVKRTEEEELRKEEGRARLRLEEDERKHKVEEVQLEEERKKAQEEKECAEREAEERQKKEALDREEAQLEADAAQDILSSPVECKAPEEGEVIKDGGLAELRVTVKGDSASKPAKGQKEALQMDTLSIPPPSEVPRRRLGPHDSSVAPLSALTTTKNIERLQDVKYPKGVRGPREDLNKDAKDGKFRYDRGFLLQFMHICKEKPLNLARLDVLGIEPVDQTSLSMTRGGSGRQIPGAMTPSVPPQDSVGVEITGAFGGKAGSLPSPFAMGQFSTPTSKLTSEERPKGVRSASVGGTPANLQYQSKAMTSQGEPSGHAMGTKRTRTKRLENETNKAVLSQQGQGHGFGAPGVVHIFGAALEPVASLEASANRCITTISTSRKPIASDADSPELVDRKVRSLLNELTMEKFDSISDQIIAWANKSVNESDGRTLSQVIGLVLEKAIDDVAWSEVYARLCRKMMERISPEVRHNDIKTMEGKPIAGDQLFTKYLFNRCQEGLKRGWFAKETTAAAAAAKTSNDQVIKTANDKKGEASEFYSDAYYAAQKAKATGSRPHQVH
ncbi:hypothetical protein PAXINDRAFT_102754, partial [Paxillus involutus ATCC 200175]